MEPEGSSLHSQEAATGSLEANSRPYMLYLDNYFNTISLYVPMLSKLSHQSGIRPNFCMHTSHVSYPVSSLTKYHLMKRTGYTFISSLFNVYIFLLLLLLGPSILSNP
jgi:hypothetical protein